MAMASNISTRFLIISDTHGEQLEKAVTDKVDVAIHCGDLTEESKLAEFQTTLSLLKNINAELKLVIAGNHDFTLDDEMFAKKIEELERVSDVDDALIETEYGAQGAARSMIDDAKTDGIIFLDEGMHQFKLANGAFLKVFASPFTPSTNDWGFQYDPREGHKFEIDSDTDVVISHGPPRGILDLAGLASSRKRAGCKNLFESIARARPRSHCFGHIHSSWGAKEVVWRDQPSVEPTHFTDINNDKSRLIESLSSITPNAKIDTDAIIEEKIGKMAGYRAQGYCSASSARDDNVQKTMFVNTAIKTDDDEPQQLPWLIELDLPIAPSKSETSSKEMPVSEKRKLEDIESSVEIRHKCSHS